MDWPKVKKFTFITIGSYFKTHPKENEMNRQDVYNYMQDLKNNGKTIFVDTKPYERMVWNYVDNFVEEGFLIKTDSHFVGNNEHYKFKMTTKGIDYHKRVSFALNFGPSDIPNLVDSPNLKKDIAKKIDDSLERSYPAPSIEDFKKEYASIRKMREKTEDGA